MPAIIGAVKIGAWMLTALGARDLLEWFKPEKSSTSTGQAVIQVANFIGVIVIAGIVYLFYKVVKK